MTKILAAALCVAVSATLALTLAGCGAVQAQPPATSTAAANEAPPPAFDVAMPAPQEPLDTTPITAVETVGASRTE